MNLVGNWESSRAGLDRTRPDSPYNIQELTSFERRPARDLNPFAKHGNQEEKQQDSASPDLSGRHPVDDPPITLRVIRCGPLHVVYLARPGRGWRLIDAPFGFPPGCRPGEALARLRMYQGLPGDRPTWIESDALHAIRPRP